MDLPCSLHTYKYLALLCPKTRWKQVGTMGKSQVNPGQTSNPDRIGCRQNLSSVWLTQNLELTPYTTWNTTSMYCLHLPMLPFVYEEKASQMPTAMNMATNWEFSVFFFFLNDLLQSASFQSLVNVSHFTQPKYTECPCMHSLKFQFILELMLSSCLSWTQLRSHSPSHI
jgi:hypothetical protein